MLNNIWKASPYLTGTVIAVILTMYPEAKPIACGGGFVLPFLGR